MGTCGIKPNKSRRKQDDNMTENSKKKGNSMHNKINNYKITNKKAITEVTSIQNMAKDEIDTGHKPIPIKIINKVMKSICKIIIINNKKKNYGTGFFLYYTDKIKYLITNYHIINENNTNNTEIEIWNHKKMKLNLNNRYIKYIPKPKDITIIEIKETDNIYKDIEFLKFDYNGINHGYEIYINADIFTIEHPYGDDSSCASGRIINIDEYEFIHNISTDNGSSGCPIILLNNNINLIQVIGIHKNADYRAKLNGGTFIGEIFNEINNINYIKNKNYIIAEIYITKENLNKDIRIINSYEEERRTKGMGYNIEDKYKNEDEIKKCEIKINDKIISFNYKYKFISIGKYIINYSFKDNINKTNCMFADCNLLTNINLSNFNTENVISMRSMFWECSSLNNINLSYFNTKNLTNMDFMFWGCSSLTNINLSDFITKNVTNMIFMFWGCSSLTSINLSNFNTKKAEKYGMFSNCKALKIENIVIKDKTIFNDNSIFNPPELLLHKYFNKTK